MPTACGSREEAPAPPAPPPSEAAPTDPFAQHAPVIERLGAALRERALEDPSALASPTGRVIEASAIHAAGTADRAGVTLFFDSAEGGAAPSVVAAITRLPDGEVVVTTLATNGLGPGRPDTYRPPTEIVALADTVRDEVTGGCRLPVLTAARALEVFGPARDRESSRRTAVTVPDRCAQVAEAFRTGGLSLSGAGVALSWRPGRGRALGSLSGMVESRSSVGFTELTFTD